MGVLLLVKRDSLVFYDGDLDAPIVCSISSEIVKDLEIISEDHLTSAISSCIPRKPKEKQIPIVLVLSDDVCFSQSLSAGKEEVMTKQFEVSVPFAQVAKTTVTLNGHTLLYATNQTLYEAISLALTQNGFLVIGVVPWALLASSGISKNGEVDKQTVKRVFDTWSTLKLSAFPLERSMSRPSQPIAPTTSQKKKIPIGWILFGALSIAYAIVMLVFVM